MERYREGRIRYDARCMSAVGLRSLRGDVRPGGGGLNKTDQILVKHWSNTRRIPIEGDRAEGACAQYLTSI